MIAAQWEPAWRLLLVIGTGLAGWGGYLAVRWVLSLPLRAVDAWRNRVEPEWREIDAREQANAHLRAEGYR